jgi:hypothetical protein
MNLSIAAGYSNDSDAKTLPPDPLLATLAATPTATTHDNVWKYSKRLSSSKNKNLVFTELMGRMDAGAVEGEVYLRQGQARGFGLLAFAPRQFYKPPCLQFSCGGHIPF